jgi:hypothetical protein
VLIATTTGQTSSTANHLNYLTFSRAVALPGVVLPAGSYAFEVANINTSGDVVRVASRYGKRQLFMGFTERVERPSGLPRDQAVSLGEGSGDVPPPIVAWYPIGEAGGHRFIYR